MAYTTITAATIGLADGDQNPTLVNGTVRITPRFPAMETSTGLIATGPVVVEVTSGAMPKTEVPAQESGTALVEFHLYDPELGPVSLPNTEIPVEPGSTISLSDYLPAGVDPSTGWGIAKGDPGPGVTRVSGQGGDILIEWEGGGSGLVPMPDAIEGPPGPRGPIGPTGSVELTGVVPEIVVGADSLEIGGKDMVITTDHRLPLESTDSQWRYAITDGAGYISAAVGENGAFHVFRGAGAPASIRDAVVCMGDSLTKGNSHTYEESYPALMQGNYPHISVENRGYSGRTVDEIRVVNGSLTVVAKPVGGVIPASGPVALTTDQVIGWSPSNSTVIQATMAGVPGKFTRVTSGLTFERTSSGPPVPVPTPTPIVADVPDFSNHTVVLWAGRNDVSYGTKGTSDTVAEHVVSSVMEAVDWLAPRSKSVVVIGTTNKQNEVRGSAGYNTVVAINDKISQLLPHKYLNIRRYLVHQAIYDAGVTPTQEDLDNMEQDAPPPSIWDGGSHYLIEHAPLVANFIGDRLAAKGYI